jgi:hypothetical protein
MQVNLFSHPVMRSTVNRPNRDDDFCFTGTGICTGTCDPPEQRTFTIHGLQGATRHETKAPARGYTGTGKMTMDEKIR